MMIQDILGMSARVGRGRLYFTDFITGTNINTKKIPSDGLTFSYSKAVWLL